MQVTEQAGRGGEAVGRVDPEPYAGAGVGFRVYRRRGGGAGNPPPCHGCDGFRATPNTLLLTPASPQAHEGARVAARCAFPPPTSHTPPPSPPPPLRRTRAHVSLRDVPMEALERALDEEMVEVEVEAAEEEGLWQDFLQVRGGLVEENGG